MIRSMRVLSVGILPSRGATMQPRAIAVSNLVGAPLNAAIAARARAAIGSTGKTGDKLTRAAPL